MSPFYFINTQLIKNIDLILFWIVLEKIDVKKLLGKKSQNKKKSNESNNKTAAAMRKVS